MRHLLLPAIATLLVVGPFAPARADSIRSWVDRDGVVHYSNVGGAKKKRGAARMEQLQGGGVKVSLQGKDDVPRTNSGNPFPAREVGEFDEHLREACERYRIPFALAKAVLASESNFNSNAVSHAGAMGLMQLMPETAVTMYVDDILDPRENIHGGVRYLRVLTNEFDGDVVKVIAAYNAGPAAVKRAGGVPNIAETQEYVKRVLHLYKTYKERLASDRT